MDSPTSVSQSIPLEQECCLCPNPAPEGQTFRGSKGRFCNSCLPSAHEFSAKELSNLKLKALRIKKRARGLCSRYRCTSKPVEGKTYCIPCSKYQNKAVIKYRVSKAAGGKSSSAVPVGTSNPRAAKPTEYRRITIASLLCD